MMNLRMLRGLLLALPVITSACSLLPDDQAMAYLDSKEQPVVRNAPGTNLKPVDAYPIPELPGNPQAAAEFEVPRPAPYAGEDESDAVMSLAEFRSGAANVRLETDGSGTLILRLDGAYASNWAEVTEAIGRTKLKMTDLNRSTGTYYLEIQSVVRKEDCGWWSSLWGCDEVRTDTYLLKMNRARNGVYLSLLTDADTLADETLTADVLKQVKAKLEQ